MLWCCSYSTVSFPFPIHPISVIFSLPPLPAPSPITSKCSPAAIAQSQPCDICRGSGKVMHISMCVHILRQENGNICCQNAHSSSIRPNLRPGHKLGCCLATDSHSDQSGKTGILLTEILLESYWDQHALITKSAWADGEF